MTESVKTVIAAGAALVAALLAYATRPVLAPPKSPAETGKPLFEFENTDEVASLEIVKYDESLNTFSTFKVAKDKVGQWTIPSHDGYPADAADKMKGAALSLIDLKVLNVITDKPGEHKSFGVLQAKDKENGEPGTGTRITLRNPKDKVLADLIVGKKAKSKERESSMGGGGGEAQRFVRVAGQDPVYVVKFDLDKLSTKFEDWIEKDLLKLNAWDIKQVKLKDYAVLPTVDGSFALNNRFECTVKYESTDGGKWKIDELLTFSGGKPVPSQLLETEELNSERLNELKTAVDDLKIADVHRKPKGLTADLKTDAEFLKSREAVQSLVGRGFYPLRLPGKEAAEIMCANGEVHVWVEDAVQYILRFGNNISDESGSSEAKLNRLLFVTTRVDESKIPYPTLETVPTDDAKKPEDKKDEPKAEDKSDEKKDEKKDDKAKDDEEVKKAELEKEKERITKENARKIDDYNAKLKKAKEKVAELNARFADWYYVISDDVYKKIHLSREDLIKESDAKAKQEGTGVDAFRELQKEGLK